jgi:hypothetical protein
LDPQESRVQAVASLLTIWQQPQPSSILIPADMMDRDYFNMAARQYGLRLLSVENDWDLVKQLNIPAIIVLRAAQSMSPVYLTLVSWQDDLVKLTDGDHKHVIEVDYNSLIPYLTGYAYIFWRNVTGFDAIIAQGSDNQAVLNVKMMLRKIGYSQVGSSPYFDQFTREAIIDFQGRHGLKRDGLVGPLTKIFLIIDSKAYIYPVLSRENETGL